MKLSTKIASAAAAMVMTAGVSLVAAAPASATATDCHWGLVNATKAWGQCRSHTGSWGGFELVVNCYYYPQQRNYGMAPNTIWASCPSWSHVTYMNAFPAAF